MLFRRQALVRRCARQDPFNDGADLFIGLHSAAWELRPDASAAFPDLPRQHWCRASIAFALYRNFMKAGADKLLVRLMAGDAFTPARKRKHGTL
jgi:hypothetical protein